MPDSSLVDVQAASDNRNIKIQAAGIENLKIPLTFIEQSGKSFSSIAKFSAWTAVAVGKRGAHMSRLAEFANQWKNKFTLNDIPQILDNLTSLMESKEVGFSLNFPLFLERNTPISNKASWIDFQVNLEANIQETKIAITIPVTTLCPCSKEISKDGAHSQRSYLTVTLFTDTKFSVEINTLAAEYENFASAKLDAVLKREDEKKITEEAYANPRFAEDVVRDVATSIMQQNEFTKWEIKISNLESIHNHDAFAKASSVDQR